MNYAEMSDIQINELVISVLIKQGAYTDDRQEVSDRPYVSDGWNWGIGTKTNLVNRDGSPLVTHQRGGYKLDYCNNPADAWPIIVENAIALEPDTQSFCDEMVDWFLTGDWTAYCQDPDKFTGKAFTDENPLRAAMVVFLMMKEGE